MPRKIISSKLKDEIIKSYLQRPISIKDIAKQYHLSSPVVGKILNNTKKWNKTQIFSPDIQEDWFNIIDNQDKAYYLGLFITDGNVFLYNNSASCNICLFDKDKYILEKWLLLVHSNKKVSSDGRGCSQAVIMSKKMANDLSKYGVVPNKSLHSYLPLLSDDMMPHLIRGIIDGDGNITAQWHKNCDGRYRFLHKIAICGTHQLMQDMIEYLNKVLSLKVIPKIYDCTDKKLSEVHFSNYQDIKKIGNYIYNNADTYLIRKKEKYDFILQRIKDRQQCANQLNNE